MGGRGVVFESKARPSLGLGCTGPCNLSGLATALHCSIFVSRNIIKFVINIFICFLSLPEATQSITVSAVTSLLGWHEYSAVETGK